MPSSIVDHLESLHAECSGEAATLWLSYRDWSEYNALLRDEFYERCGHRPGVDRRLEYRGIPVRPSRHVLSRDEVTKSEVREWPEDS